MTRAQGMMKLIRHSRSTCRQRSLVCRAITALALVLCGCSEKKAPDFVAKVGGREIRSSDLQREAQRRSQLHRAMPDKETLLSELIEHEALVQRARGEGLDKDPQLVREMENLLIGKLLERELARRIDAVTISSNEVKAEYEASLARYSQPPKSRLAILFLEANSKSSESKRAETRDRVAEARRRYLENPEATRGVSAVPGFGALAIHYSDDQASRYRGGDIGWLDGSPVNGRLPKAVIDAGLKLEKGALSDVLETDAGYFLVMKTDARPGSVTPLEKVEASLRQAVLLKKRRELDESFRHEAIRLAGVTINSNQLKAVELPMAPRAVASNAEAGPPSFPMLNDAPRRN